MILILLCILMFIPSFYSFQFLYSDPFGTNVYDYSFETIIALECKLPDIQKINTTIMKVYDQANTKFPMPTTAQTDYDSLITNEYYVHLSLMNTEIQKILTVNQKIVELHEFYTPSVLSPAHQVGQFEVNEKFLNNTYNALDYLTKVVKTALDAAVDWNSFKQNHQAFSGVVFQFRFLQENLYTLYTNLDSFYESLKLAKQNIITDELAAVVSTVEYNTPKTDIKIISSYIIDGSPTYYIKKIEYHNQKIGNKQVPIMYENFGLKEGYLFDQTIHKFTKPTNNLLSYNERLNLDKCLKALNSENFNDTLKYCEFQFNPSKNFVATNEGILLYKANQMALTQINHQLELSLTQADLPVHVSFNGILTFLDTEVGLVSFKRLNSQTVQKSSFSKDQVNFMTDYLKKKENKTKKDLSFPEFFENNYLEMLINVLAVIVVFLFISLLQQIYFKVSKRCKLIPMERNILKMVRKSRV